MLKGLARLWKQHHAEFGVLVAFVALAVGIVTFLNSRAESAKREFDGDLTKTIRAELAALTNGQSDNLGEKIRALETSLAVHDKEASQLETLFDTKFAKEISQSSQQISILDGRTSQLINRVVSMEADLKLGVQGLTQIEAIEKNLDDLRSGIANIQGKVEVIAENQKILIKGFLKDVAVLPADELNKRLDEVLPLVELALEGTVPVDRGLVNSILRKLPSTEESAAIEGAVGHFQLAINPPETVIFIDSAYYGTAAMFSNADSAILLEPGTYSIKLANPNYEEVVLPVRLEAGERQALIVNLEPTVLVQHGPAGPLPAKSSGKLVAEGFGNSAVYINGEYYANTLEISDPTHLLGLGPGTYAVTIAPADGGAKWEDSVTINTNEATFIRKLAGIRAERGQAEP